MKRSKHETNSRDTTVLLERLVWRYELGHHGGGSFGVMETLSGDKAMTATNKNEILRNVIKADEAADAASERTRVAWDKMQVARKYLQEAMAAVNLAQESEEILWDELRAAQNVAYAA